MKTIKINFEGMVAHLVMDDDRLLCISVPCGDYCKLYELHYGRLVYIGETR